jgi:hypothetical protein
LKEDKGDRTERLEVSIPEPGLSGDVDDLIFEEESYRCSEK